MGTTLRRGSAKHLDAPTKSPAALGRVAPIVNVDQLRGEPISGGVDDSRRTRIVKAFYERLPDERVIYLDITNESPYAPTLNQKQVIYNGIVPSARTFVLDSVKFFARTAVGGALIPAGVVEGALQCYFTIGGVGQAHVTTRRFQPGLSATEKAYFPFLNERVGAEQAFFAWYAKTGQDLEAFYLNQVPPPVAIGSVGVRVRGFETDTTIFEEILEQQR